MEAKFCTTCGAPLVNGACERCLSNSIAIIKDYDNNKYNNNKDNDNNKYYDNNKDNDNNKYKKIFVNNDEQFVDAIGNSYLKEYVTSGHIRQSYAVISDKRLYFNGKQYILPGNGRRRKIEVINESKIVDLKDVTGTGIINNQTPKTVLVLGIALMIYSLIMLAFFSKKNSDLEDLIILLVFVVFFSGGLGAVLRYIFNRQNFLKIDFAGGNIALLTKWYPFSEIESFQKNLRIAKDKAIKAEQNATQQLCQTQIAVPQSGISAHSGADELLKYASLLKEGLITQQEYDDIKTKILNK